MAGRPKTAGEIKQAIVLRDGGYSLAAISERTGISVATLARHFKKHGVSKGALTDQAVIEAREQLLSDAGFIDSLKHEIASAIVDDITQFKRIRAALALNIDELVLDSSLPAHYRSRGLTAAATGLRLSQEIIRKALQIDNVEPEEGELPELIVRELLPSEVEQLRQEQQADSAYDLPAPEEIEVVVEGEE